MTMTFSNKGVDRGLVNDISSPLFSLFFFKY